ncbi:phage portal protein [Endozoicomonas sp. SCSIO W0465]|uniref:phage portal protein n=1 Tax=Endozoicomonas sp. SCSIO W0465 TaxID=2918516 RepID=UPI0020763CED|nr:phage portal protein [Endozoicomonas sp. SCSIO W0465]USE39227.1 phage portal protein [Endozoicomonas sp. SCSIO W0465]
MKWFNSKRQLQQELARVKQELATIRAEADAAESRGRTFEELMDVLGIKSHSGSVVTHQSALQVAAVFACVSLISGAIASIPLKVYQRKANGIREESDHHPLLLKLCLEPSPMVTALVFWETLVTDMLLDGNAYAVIDRDLNGRVRRLIYVNPASVNVRLVEGELSYIVAISPDREQLPRATRDDIAFVGFYPSDILHFPGVGWNGKTGMSVIKSAALNSVGNALSADQFTGLYFKQGISSPGYIKFPQKLTREQFEMMREYWKSHVVGAEQAHLPPIITEGGEFAPLNIKADDVQLLETRKFQVLDIARIFGVPPHMIGAQETTTSWGTGIEQQSIGFVRYTLRPHLTRIEQELNRKLFRSHLHFSEFDVNALLRGDIKARNEAHQIALGGNQNPGWKTVNEIRREENLRPVDDGDALYQPVTGEQHEPAQTDEPDSEEPEELRHPGTDQ